MSDQTLFTEQPNTESTSTVVPQTIPETTPPTDVYGTLLQGIKTDDGRQKYATVSDAINSIPHKEQHIVTLESENSVLREELEAWKAKIAAAEALTMTQNSTTTAIPQTETTSPGIDVDTLTQQVTAKLSAQEQAKVRKERLKAFSDKVISTYGDKAKAVFTSKLAERGLSEKLIQDMEAQSPGSAWNFLGLDTTPVETNSVPASTRNMTSTAAARPDTGYSFRPKGQKRPGASYAAQRELTLKRLAESE